MYKFGEKKIFSERYEIIKQTQIVKKTTGKNSVCCHLILRWVKCQLVGQIYLGIGAQIKRIYI